MKSKNLLEIYKVFLLVSFYIRSGIGNRFKFIPTFQIEEKKKQFKQFDPSYRVNQNFSTQKQNTHKQWMITTVP